MSHLETIRVAMFTNADYDGSTGFVRCRQCLERGIRIDMVPHIDECPIPSALDAAQTLADLVAMFVPEQSGLCSDHFDAGHYECNICYPKPANRDSNDAHHVKVNSKLADERDAANARVEALEVVLMDAPVLINPYTREAALAAWCNRRASILAKEEPHAEPSSDT